MSESSAEPNAAQLSPHQCLALLRSVQVSRLAVCTPDGPGIFPVNHVVDHGTLVIRTAPGTKLSAATAPDARVAIEADGMDPDSGEVWSVVARGRAREITGLHDLLDAEHLGVTPFEASPKHRFLRIEPHDLTGRRFAVSDPERWRSVLTFQRRTPSE